MDGDTRRNVGLLLLGALMFFIGLALNSMRETDDQNVIVSALVLAGLVLLVVSGVRLASRLMRSAKD